MKPSTRHSSGSPPPAQSIFTWFVPIILFAVAGVLVALPSGVSIPMHEPVHVTPDQFKAAAVRTPMADPPTTVIGTYAQNCNTCHQLFESIEPTPAQLNQHLELVHDHGLNNRCFNCHDNHDRERLVLLGGSTIPMSDVITLCTQCHGPTYRDWAKGIHGKTMGSWDASSGNQVRLGCTDCHDAHAPAFGQWELLPGPRTLRTPLPDPQKHKQSKPTANPLLRWLDKETKDTGHKIDDTDGQNGEQNGEQDDKENN